MQSPSTPLESVAKRRYHTPLLIDHGDIASTTAGNAGPSVDGMSSNPDQPKTGGG